jgi:adenylate cyclase
MADVFVSYARSSEPVAEQLCNALRNAGFSVWRDDELPAHRAYGEVIEERLKASKAVVVLWSADAAHSQWVRAEADAAREAGTLVQASVDGTIPPMPFNQVQCADLKNWEGDPNAAGWKKVEASVSALVGGDAPSESPNAGATPRKNGICVLPFANMSGDAEQEYFSDGISEDITTDLSKVSALAVTARNTAFTLKGAAVDVCEIARRLGVSHVLEGSVRKAGNRVRITAQLIDGATGDHVWAERYDRDLTDIFEIQDEITKEIVAALKLKLLPREKKAIEQRGTTSADAYNLYLMARQYWITGNHGDIRREERVIRICERAVEIDPDYAQAWALKALAEATLKFGYGREGDGGLGSAARALSIDPNIAEAHCVIARHHSDEGRDAEADAELEIALKLNPESWEVNKETARQRMLQGRIPEAMRFYEKATELVENDYHAWAMLITCYQSQGMAQQTLHAAQMMIEGAEKAVAEDPSNGSALGIGAGGLAVLGQEQRAREWIERAILIDPDNNNMRYNFACVLATHLGDREAAIEMLSVPLATAGGILIRHLDTDPDLDSLRSDPRFQKMVADAKARVGRGVGAATPAGAAEPLRS